jgi:hypothetical protein
MATGSEQPPDRPDKLAAWFADAVTSEIAALEKAGGAQSYEVLSGKFLESVNPTKAVFEFIVADATRIPEDATGRLKTADNEYTATVIGQQANRIRVLIEGRSAPGSNIARALLIVDDTALLRRLAEVLQGIAVNPAAVSPLATTVFHPTTANVSTASSSSIAALKFLDVEKQHVIDQARGSSLTYIWGPPGTGKTHLIAHLIAALVESGERVMVSSHTHAAVDQALYALVKTAASGAPEEQGPLSASPLLRDGKILRIGQTADRKVTDLVRLDNVLEVRAQDLQRQILEIEARVRPIEDRLHFCETGITQWGRLAEFKTSLQEAHTRVEQSKVKQRVAESAIGRAQALVVNRRIELQQAERAWFRRAARVQQAAAALKGAEAAVRVGQADLIAAVEEGKVAQDLVRDMEIRAGILEKACGNLPSRQSLQAEMSSLIGELEPLEAEILTIRGEISHLEQRIIQDARAVFCTLAKGYVGKELDGQKFDAVIVDEISMALPPLLFLAGGRATSRVILVGDFLQLPPIIRSDEPISNERLAQDAFHLAGIAHEMKPARESRILARLTTQRRMAPEIADVARHLVYRGAGLRLTDDVSVKDRPTPSWLNFLPENPLVIVDTADLHCWSGKQLGTLSRFNFYSATLAAELAAMAATRLPKPAEEGELSIGVVTPYAAQRRLLGRLVKSMSLDDWAAVGTVHTFQGGQAQLIIFDSVLDEPYWSARLCTPDDKSEVMRELNVAVTRAKFKFVFIGSSEWLNRYARPASAMGEIWNCLRERADLVSATELVELGFADRVRVHTGDPQGWSLSHSADNNGPAHEILDEETFFQRFATDIASSTKSIFGLVPYFGEYRWPLMQPLFSAALDRGVEVTLVTPPSSEAENRGYVEKAIQNLRELGAVVISSSGLHGKDIVIDERIHYTGSLNWASHRGRMEIMHRTESPELARLVSEYLQARYIRIAAIHEDGKPRTCPECGGPTHIVNQRVQGRFGFRQALKVGCARYQETGCRYLRDLDERPPFRDVPRCQKDGRTKYRRVRRGRGEVWQCPKHPRDCPTQRVVQGDPT